MLYEIWKPANSLWVDAALRDNFVYGNLVCAQLDCFVSEKLWTPTLRFLIWISQINPCILTYLCGNLLQKSGKANFQKGTRLVEGTWLQMTLLFPSGPVLNFNLCRHILGPGGLGLLSLSFLLWHFLPLFCLPTWPFATFCEWAEGGLFLRMHTSKVFLCKVGGQAGSRFCFRIWGSCKWGRHTSHCCQAGSHFSKYEEARGENKHTAHCKSSWPLRGVLGALENICGQTYFLTSRI